VVRHQGQVAGQLEQLEGGDPVQVSEVEGPGFPVHLLKGHDALLIATGTGFGPVRATVEVLRQRRAETGRIVVLYGAMTTAHLVYREEFDAWAREGVEVRPVLFQPDAGWTGLTGWVQHHLDALPLSNAFAFLCGHRAMEEEVRKQLVARGLRDEHVFTNT
jgi:NAD(P)H-flavin reductase